MNEKTEDSNPKQAKEEAKGKVKAHYPNGSEGSNPKSSDPKQNVQGDGKPKQQDEPENRGQAQKITADNSTIKDNQMATTKNGKIVQTNIRQVVFGESKKVEIKKFTVAEANPLTEEEIKACESLFVYPEGGRKDLISCLYRNRLMFLAGHAGRGKFFTAKYLSSYFVKESSKKHKIRWFNPLITERKIELMELINDPKELKNTILIFRNILSENNQRIINFFRACSPEQTELISGKLKELDAYIMFTADNRTFDQSLFSHMLFKKEAAFLDRNLLAKGLELKLRYFCSKSSQMGISKVLLSLDNKKEEIIEKAKSMRKISFFVDTVLYKILDGSAIDESIKEFFGDPAENIKKWFLKDMTVDRSAFEASTFALCLTLFNGAVYADFVDFHREVTALLLKKFASTEILKEFNFTFQENVFFERCRARITKDGASNSYRIEFFDNEYREVLSEILWRDNKKVLLFLVPLLQKFAEKAPNQHLRKLAITSLVYIGAIAPESIIIPTVYKWAQMKNTYDWINIGYLYETVFNNENEGVKNYCMNKLKEMALSSEINEKIIAIGAYRRIGDKNLEFAMEELCKIPGETNDQKIIDFFEEWDKIQDDNELKDVLGYVYTDSDDPLPYIHFSITVLAVTHNPIDLFNELKKWINNEDNDLKARVALFVMGWGGILEELETQRKEYFAEDEIGEKKSICTNSLLFPLIGSEESAKKMADFFYQLYSKCFPEFRADVNRAFRRMLFKHMEEWVVNNLSNSGVSNALKNMLNHFYHAGDKELKEMLWNSITSWKVTERKGKKEAAEKKMNDFINDVRELFFASKGVQKW